MNTALAKLLILVYGLSITGYGLLDSGHEILHSFTNTLHHHEVDHHGYDHDVNDYHTIFIPGDEQDGASITDSIKIFGFFLFYHSPADYLVFNIDTKNSFIGLFKKLPTLSQAPLTPPPLI